MCGERERQWQTANLPSTCLIPKTIRIYDMEMAVHARHAENMRYLLERERRLALQSDDPPYPRQGLKRERWCLLCYRLLVASDGSGDTSGGLPVRHHHEIRPHGDGGR